MANLDKETIKVISSQLSKSLVVLDIETTGLANSEVLQFAAIKFFPKSTKIEELTFLVKPSGKISEEALAVHNINDDKVKNEKPFKFYAKTVASFIKDCDIGGFNHRYFDIKILTRQLEECGVKDPFAKAGLIDIFSVYCNHSSRKLADCFKFYFDKAPDGALHDALFDVKTTVACLSSQLQRENISLDEMIKKFTKDKKENGVENDPISKWIVYNDKNEAIWNFSKHKGEKVSSDLGFSRWVLKSDFPQEIKEIIKKNI